MFGGQRTFTSVCMRLVAGKLRSGLSFPLEDILADPCGPSSLNGAWHMIGAYIKEIFVE